MAANEETESLAERQENELQVLQAIYSDDVQDLRLKDAWKVTRPPELKISLRPQESMNTDKAHVSIDLYIKCPVHYPDVIPVFKFENAKGLSNSQVAGLKCEVDGLAKSLLGEVMIHDVCQHIQMYLHAHNKPPAKSFYEEMMTNKKKQEEKHAKDQQKKLDLMKRKEERELQQIELEIQKRKEEARRRRSEAKQIEKSSLSEPNTPLLMHQPSITPILRDNEQKRFRHSVSSSPDFENSGSPVLQFCSDKSPIKVQKPRRRRTSTPVSQPDEEQPVEDRKDEATAVLIFNTKNTERLVQRGKCIGSSKSSGSTVYVGMEMNSGELVAVSEWIVKWRHANRKLDLDEKRDEEKEAARYMKQVATCETELLSLLRLHHPNLAHFLAISYQQDQGKVTLNVLMEYVGGGNLQQNISKRQPLSIDILRAYSCQLLEALAYLHNKAVVHRDLRPSSILIDQSGQVRLTDYSLVKRLSELMTAVDVERPGVKFQVNNLPPTLGRGGKKGDIYRLGISLLSLAQGYQVEDLVPEVPTGFPQDFHDFLNKCLIRDERHRWSAHELLEHDFIKTPIVSTPERKVHVNREEEEKKRRSPEREEDDVESGEIPFIPASDSGSRLQNEFEILKWLGKGGFGDVIKVKNKLDGRNYAIKRIPLNPKNDTLKRKITREVKLLSRLNHENVVRYYNSWIETSEEVAQSDESTISNFTSSSRPSDTSSMKSPPPVRLTNPMLKNSLGLSDDIEMFAPPPVNQSVEWSVSVDFRDSSSSDSSSESETEDNDVFGASFLPHSDSEDDGIVFEQDDEYSNEKDASVLNKTEKMEPAVLPKLQFLYIQMEFCEKSTLRNCIDAGLYEDGDRVWRLFREMIEGLVHIHEQGMIHRDLKPVNIFLDSNDHVKIGDFGLATTDIISKQQHSLIDISVSQAASMSIIEGMCNTSKSESLDDAGGSLTGKVGTALYVAPEIMTSNARTHYNQKVDIYSLGIMFFEMCYKPLVTGMERVKILNNLRKSSVELPEDFDEVELSNHCHIIRWLLNHDPSKRPTSQELLQSDFLPPPQLEEAELNEVLRSTISNPEGKTYKHMIQEIFKQPIIKAMDFAYDADFYKSPYIPRQFLVQRAVLDRLESIFQRHGAMRLTTPLLMPKSQFYDNNETYVCFMDHSGGLVGLPYDLRVPFARYVAKNSITHLKRYAIEKVYRENKWYNSHPRELTACAFDFVSGTSANLISDAEVIHVVHEVISEFPELQNRNYYLRINHTALLKGILVHCGVSDDLHHEVYKILGDTKVEKQKKLQVQTKLCSLSLSHQSVAQLYSFIETEADFKKTASMLRCITKTRGHAGSLAKKGLHEMEAVLSHLAHLDCSFKVSLALGLVNHVQHFSGMLFQVVADVRKKKKTTIDVLAAGGRYDNLVQEYRKPGSQTLQQCAVGMSISFDKIVSVVQECENVEVNPSIDTLICSVGHKTLVKEKLTVAKDLWCAGLHADVLHDTSQSLEEVQDRCRTEGISQLVILKDGAEAGTVKIRSIEKERISEKKVNMAEIVDFVQQKMSTRIHESNEVSGGSGTGGTKSQGNAQINLHEKESGAPSSTAPPTITFFPQDGTKFAKNQKRTYETQIYNTVMPSLANISGKCQVEIIGLDLISSVVKTIAAFLELGQDESDFEASISSVIEKHARYRKYLTRIFDFIHEKKFEKNVNVFLLYSLKDDSFKILM